jgi:hypothetical protein
MKQVNSITANLIIMDGILDVPHPSNLGFNELKDITSLENYESIKIVQAKDLDKKDYVFDRIVIIGNLFVIEKMACDKFYMLCDY